MAKKITRKKLIIIIAAVVLLLGAGAAVAFAMGIFTPGDDTTGTETVKVTKTGTEYKTGLTKKTSQATALVDSGDQKSVEQAEKIINQETEAAKKSKNVGYIVDANLAKADLLNQTDRPKEAVELLLTLEQQYAPDGVYNENIYAALSRAYYLAGDTAKSDEYFAKIKPRGGE